MNEMQIKEKIKELFDIGIRSDIDYSLAKFYRNEKMIQEAIKLGLQGVQKSPDSVFLWKFLAMAYNLNDLFEEQIRCRYNVISINPLSLYNWIDLSFAYRSNGNIIISDWMNFNIELFRNNYLRLGFKQLNEKRFLQIFDIVRQNTISL